MQILIDIKTISLLAALSNQGMLIYKDLNNLELIGEEPINEILRISKGLQLLDNSFTLLEDINITNSQITISNQSFDYESPSDLLTGQSLFQRIVNAKLKENGSQKRVALILDSKEPEYALVLLEEEYLKQIIQGLEDLEEAGEDNPDSIADYISDTDSRVFEIFTALEHEPIHFFGRLGEPEW